MWSFTPWVPWRYYEIPLLARSRARQRVPTFLPLITAPNNSAAFAPNTSA